MTGNSIIDLTTTTPTLLPHQLREVAIQALELSASPYNVLDNNPFITKEWLIVNIVLHEAAQLIEQRLLILFYGDCDNRIDNRRDMG
jgi:hypothetical protein